jgi:hypothetical protein
MLLKIIACRVLFRELSYLAAQSENTIDVVFLDQRFHDQPDSLRNALQEEIAKTEDEERPPAHSPYARNREYDAILLGYALCSNSIVGLRSNKHRLVVPKAHDCISLFLGNRKRYREYFDSHPGTYWYTRGWMENVLMPGKDRYEKTRAHYAEQYGEDNAEYLMEMEQDWLSKYNQCTFIEWPEIAAESHREETRNSAHYLGWAFDEQKGSSQLLRDFVNGEWDDRFLVVKPGNTVSPTFDERVITES